MLTYTTCLHLNTSILLPLAKNSRTVFLPNVKFAQSLKKKSRAAGINYYIGADIFF